MNVCGGCTLCCKLIAVPQLEKPVNQWCKHCKIGVGCEVYNQDSKPKVCDDFRCLWLQLELPPELRPDKTKVVLTTTTDGEKVVAFVDPGRPDAAETGAMGKFLNDMKNKEVGLIIVCGNSRKAYNINFPVIEVKS